MSLFFDVIAGNANILEIGFQLLLSRGIVRKGRGGLVVNLILHFSFINLSCCDKFYINIVINSISILFYPELVEKNGIF